MCALTHSPLPALRADLSSGALDPLTLAAACAGKADSNASRNTYLHFDPAGLQEQARALPERFPTPSLRPPLYGVPVSLKDCFDLAGVQTSCGSAFYERQNGFAPRHSAVAERLLEAGCLITGKTHLHALAYGITGQNADYGDCLQPRDAGLLTGGSSSGAAASVQEGSALAAVGTDTGGSIRVPAALCGLTGYRASHSLASDQGGWPDLWRGAAHLAPSFDTLGLIFRDPRDGPVLASALFGVPPKDAPLNPRLGCVAEDFLSGCEPEVRASYVAWKRRLPEHGAVLDDFDAGAWHDTVETFAGIQAHEAAAIHRGHFHHFEPAIAQRLAWGESLSGAEVAQLRHRHAHFQEHLGTLFDRFDLLMLPCAPVSLLRVGSDQSAARQAILRYTTPFSLGGLPTVALSGELAGDALGTGVQIAGAPGSDGSLLALASVIAERLSGAA